jgi:hypothetical protein
MKVGRGGVLVTWGQGYVGGDDSKWDVCACMDTEYMYVCNV